MTRYRCLSAILVLAALAPAFGAEDKPSFTLGKAVPENVFIYAHVAYNPEREYLDKYWGEVWAAFKKTGIIDDIHGLIGSVEDPAGRDKLEQFWKRAGELIDGVDWSARVHEFTYASRMGAPMPEFLVLLRYDEDKATKNAEAFTAVLKELQSATGGENSGLTYTESEAHGATIHTLTPKDAPFVNMRVAVRGPVVAIAVDQGLLDESLALLAGEGDKKALTESDRYRQAVAKLPPAEDSVVFFDVRAMFEGLRGILKFVSQQAPQDEKAKEIIGVVEKGLNELSFLDYLACTVHTEGYRQIDETVVTLAADAPKSRLYKVFCKPEPVEKFDRFIPKEAVAYSVSSGIDWSALYAGALDFIEKEVPGGADLLTKWDGVQDEIGFHPSRDVFSWLGSQIIAVTLPVATPTPFATADTVLLIQVRDEKQAAEKIKTGLDKLNNVLTQFQQPLTSQPADVAGAEGFRMVTHPMVAMFLHPVYGVAQGHLIIGSSAEAVQTCLATAKGEHPSVAKNERVVREGLIPKGPVTSAGFTDLTDLGKEIAQGLSMMGMFSAMIPANEPEAKPVKTIIGMLGKLAPVAMKMDFFVSQSSVTTFEKNAWHTRSVTNYRPPKASPVEATADRGS